MYLYITNRFLIYPYLGSGLTVESEAVLFLSLEPPFSHLTAPWPSPTHTGKTEHQHRYILLSIRRCSPPSHHQELIT